MRKRSDAQGKYDILDELRHDDPQFINTLAKGLSVLSAFRPEDKALGAQEISERTGLPKSTTSRLLYTLICLNYLSYNNETGKYSIGFRALGLGYTALGVWGFTEFIRPLMKEFAECHGVSVALGIREGIAMHYILVCRPDNVLHLQLAEGTRLPMPITAMGRAHIVSLPNAEKQELLRHLEQNDKANWEKHFPGIEEAEACYAEHGFVTSVGEWIDDVHSVGAPIHLKKSGDRLALNLGGPSFMLPKDKIIRKYGPKLVELAKAIKNRLSS